MRKQSFFSFLFFVALYISNKEKSQSAQTQILKPEKQYISYKAQSDHIPQENNATLSTKTENTLNTKKKQLRNVKTHNHLGEFVEVIPFGDLLDLKNLIKKSSIQVAQILTKAYNYWSSTAIPDIEDIQKKKKKIESNKKSVRIGIRDLRELQKKNPDLKNLYVKYNVVKYAVEGKNRRALAEQIKKLKDANLSRIVKIVNLTKHYYILKLIHQSLAFVLDSVAVDNNTSDILQKIKALKDTIDRENIRTYPVTEMKNKKILEDKLNEEYEKAKNYTGTNISSVTDDADDNDDPLESLDSTDSSSGESGDEEPQPSDNSDKEENSNLTDKNEYNTEQKDTWNVNDNIINPHENIDNSEKNNSAHHKALIAEHLEKIIQNINDYKDIIANKISEEPAGRYNSSTSKTNAAEEDSSFILFDFTNSIKNSIDVTVIVKYLNTIKHNNEKVEEFIKTLKETIEKSEKEKESMDKIFDEMEKKDSEVNYEEAKSDIVFAEQIIAHLQILEKEAKSFMSESATKNDKNDSENASKGFSTVKKVLIAGGVITGVALVGGIAAIVTFKFIKK